MGRSTKIGKISQTDWGVCNYFPLAEERLNLGSFHRAIARRAFHTNLYGQATYRIAPATHSESILTVQEVYSSVTSIISNFLLISYLTPLIAWFDLYIDQQREPYWIKALACLSPRQHPKGSNEINVSELKSVFRPMCNVRGRETTAE